MRRAIILVTPELFAQWFETGHVIRARCTRGLPAGAKVCSVQPAPMHDTVALVVEHESLADVEAPHPLPILTPTFEKILTAGDMLDVK